MNAAEFVARWADETDENASSQSFWNDFLAIFGIDRKRVATFEARVKRSSTGGRGRIDLFWPGVLVAEQKSAGKDLEAAEAQALDYLESLDDDDFPGMIVTSDFARIRILDLGGDATPYEFPTVNLVQEIDRFGALAGYTPRKLTPAQEHEADIAAARLMGLLYEELAGTGMEEHDVSVYLVRLLFLMFGDDTGLWEKGLFLEFLQTRTSPDGTDLGAQLAGLFQTLDKPENKRPQTLDELLALFPYVNGGLFADRLEIPSFDKAMREHLLECCRLDWGAIVPAIFGSLFQAVKSKQARRELGEHYTTETNIARLIRPLFLDELRHEFNTYSHDRAKLERLRLRLGKLRFLDPACGCGNFLVIAYRELRQMELDILVRLEQLTGVTQLSLDPTLGLQVSPAQFVGVEIEEWPARIAEAAMFLVDHQANLALARKFGNAPDRLPISTQATIIHGNACRIDWTTLVPQGRNTIILGNPPYSGGLRLTEEQREDRERVFAELPVTVQTYGRLDYVACWYAKAMWFVHNTTSRAAFVMTNSITQGEQARSLSPLGQKLGVEIFFAHRTFAWTSEAPGAANVHVVIVGFAARGAVTGPKQLFEYEHVKGEPTRYLVDHVNYWLIDYEDVTIIKPKTPLVAGVPGMTVGSQPTDGGGLTITADQIDDVLADPVAAKYVRLFPGADEMLGNSPDRWCLWLPDATPADIRNSPALRSRLAQVRASRLKSPTPAFRKAADTPQLFTHRKHPNSSYLALPQTSSSTRRCVPARFYDETVVVSNKLMLIPNCPVWVFSVMQSSMYTTWLATFGGRLKSDFNVTADLVYNVFPWPDVNGDTQDRIETAGRRVLEVRNVHPESGLADLYDPISMPPDLVAAHDQLDKTVEQAYGLPGNSPERDRLVALMDRYTQLTKETGTLPLKASRKRR